jgi:hypothetical protein
MTRGSVQEYAAAIRGRYRSANKMSKSKMLDEFVRVTGYHRKAAIRMLLKIPKVHGGRRGRPSRYGTVLGPLKAVWEASDRLCSKRLQPFLPEMVKVLRQHGEQRIDASQERLLGQVSPATIDRLLRSYRKLGGRRPLSTTQPSSVLKNSIPIRTSADWQENKPGFLEIDLVAHCGESTEGFYLTTLCAVDVASGWSECVPVWGKGQVRVRSAVHRVRQRLPFSLLGVDSDNGSEFINQCFYTYCHQEKITFTRSRSYKKNDSCHVEQKNGNIVRRLVGYDRYSSRLAYQCLERLYGNIQLYMNFFQPTMKLWSKTRHGAKVHRVYERAETPYQRLLRSDTLSKDKQAEMAALYNGLNPVLLLKQINGNLEQLWRLAERQATSGNRNYEAIRRTSVTV